jgi:hypothetical protein
VGNPVFLSIFLVYWGSGRSFFWAFEGFQDGLDGRMEKFVEFEIFLCWVVESNKRMRIYRKGFYY